MATPGGLYPPQEVGCQDRRPGNATQKGGAYVQWGITHPG